MAKLETIEGIGPKYGATLSSAGITNTDHLLKECGSKKGRKALAKIESFDPHVVLTDLKMPRMGGLELLEKGKARAPYTAFECLYQRRSGISCSNSGGWPSLVAQNRIGMIKQPGQRARLEHKIRTHAQNCSTSGNFRKRFDNFTFRQLGELALEALTCRQSPQLHAGITQNEGVNAHVYLRLSL